jgi:hypothetical protein
MLMLEAPKIFPLLLFVVDDVEREVPIVKGWRLKESQTCFLSR